MWCNNNNIKVEKLTTSRFAFAQNSNPEKEEYEVEKDIQEFLSSYWNTEFWEKTDGGNINNLPANQTNQQNNDIPQFANIIINHNNINYNINNNFSLSNNYFKL